MSIITKGVSLETGEIGRLVPEGLGYQIRSPKQVEIGRNYMINEKLKGRNAGFTFTAMDAVKEVSQVLTTTQCGYLLLLQCFIDYGSNALMIKERHMTTSDMMDILQLSNKRSTFYNFYNACLESNIISIENGGHIVNPRYHFRGSTQNQSVIRSYTAKIKQIYNQVNAADLGVLYRLLPYVNYDTNALCANPSERDPLKIQWLNRKELAELIEMSEGEISRKLARLTVGNEYVIARITIGKDTRFMFNPLVFKRNNKPIDDAIQAIFNVKTK